MKLNEYQERAMATNAACSDNDMYSLFGLVAEVGEIADKVAKAVRKERISVSDDFITNGLEGDNEEFEELEKELKKELGDVLWFVAHFAYRRGWTLEDVARTNLDKLARRKERGEIIDHPDH